MLEKIIKFKNDVRKMIERVRGKIDPIDCVAYRAFKAEISKNTKEEVHIMDKYFDYAKQKGDYWHWFYKDGSCLTELEGRNVKKWIIQPYYHTIPQLRFVRKLRDD